MREADRCHAATDVVSAPQGGISGDDLDRELGRLGSAVPDGTQLVILDKAASNSASRGVSISAAITRNRARLKARGIKLIVIPGMHTWADHRIQPDGIHLTEQGHAAVAAHLLPLVIAALGKGGPLESPRPL